MSRPAVILTLIFYAIVEIIKLGLRVIASMPGWAILLVLAALVIGGKFNTYMLATYPYHGEINMVEHHIKWSRYGAGPIMSAMGVSDSNWLSLTVRNTDEQDHPVNVAVCSIRGPVYYDPNYGAVPEYRIAGGGFVSKTWAEGSHKADQWYLGERRMVVRLVAVASTKLAEGRNMTPPVMPATDRTFAWSTPDPSEREIAYFLAFPKLRLFDDDVIEWCKFGKTVADLPQDQLEPRVEWIGDHANIPIEHVALDMDVPLAVIQAVLAGAQ
jgi:hypothetical protein